MKKLKLSAIIILSLAGLAALAQAMKDVNSSVGNGKAMEVNLNFPNAINPAMDNYQKYEKEGKIEANTHPEQNLGNKYNRSSYVK